MNRFNYRKLLLIVVDFLIAVFVTLAVDLLGNYNLAFWQVALLVAVAIVSYFCFSTYSGMWRYANTRDYLRLIWAHAACVVIVVAATLVFNLGIEPIAVVAVYSLAMFGTVSSRLLYRYIKTDKPDRRTIGTKKKVPVAIVGAGYAGMMLAEELRRDRHGKYYAYAFFDKDKSKIGSKINGVRVVGSDEDVSVALRDTDVVKDVIIAVPSMDTERRRVLADLYIGKGYNVKVYEPPIDRVGLEDASAKNHIREIKIGDLLSREQVQLDVSNVSKLVTDQVVLVTGGGGSIGSELCRQIAGMAPKKLVIVDIYENNAYDIQQELIRKFGDKLNLCVEIASVRDAGKIDVIFERHKPTLVFHAAAHKHVPLMEDCGDEAVKNNIFGTNNVVNAAEKHGVKKMILISTDKAVNPTNVMGATKRFCEMIVQSKKNSKTVFAAVRFGNVLGSNGSVIPLFQRQIEQGGPVTLTDKRITRYFMTIPEAVGLVLQAAALANNAEIFVLDMGKPVKIADLAENMIRLAGYRPNEDIKIVEIGLRPGEKLYEELLMKTEELDKTSVEKVYIEKEKEISRDEIEAKLGELSKALESDSSDEVRETLKRLVPTYKSPKEVNGK